MAAAQVSNSPISQPAPGPQPPDAPAVTALVTSRPTENGQSALDLDGPLSRLPVELDVGVPIRNFRVRNLLALEPGVVVASQWEHSCDLPVRSSNQPLAWSEFEVVDSHLAVRITRLP